MVHAREDVGCVALDLHPAAPAIALLAAPELPVEESLIYFQPGGQTGKESDQSFAMGLTGGEVSEHKRSIVPDYEGRSGRQNGAKGDFNERFGLRIFTSPWVAARVTINPQLLPSVWV